MLVTELSGSQQNIKLMLETPASQLELAGILSDIFKIWAAAAPNRGMRSRREIRLKASQLTKIRLTIVGPCKLISRFCGHVDGDGAPGKRCETPAKPHIS